MSRILLVDDDQTVVSAFAEVLSELGHEVCPAGNAEQAFAELTGGEIDLVILDICLPGMSGLEALKRIKEERRKLPVIVMTGRGTMDTAIEATKLGAFEYHLKPVEPDEILLSVRKALDSARLMREQVGWGSPSPASTSETIIGRTTAMQELYKVIGRVAPTDAIVLLRGESGTGKELVARAIYHHSRRSEAPMLTVNCAAIPETLLESELFGHEQGAFTGASGRRIGKFEQAAGGTIFLDEIGDVPLGIQPKILRVLQERTFERLGGNEVLQADVRVLSATNRDLEKGIQQGVFREDLYHRLNVVTIRVPPLRERRDDIPDLVAYFLERFAKKLGVEKPLLLEDALQALVNYPWPGNVRELEHCIHRLVIFGRGLPVGTADLLPMLQPENKNGGQVTDADDATLANLIERYLGRPADRAYEQFMQKVERLLLTQALARTGQNQSQAARLLGLPRPTLHAKMYRHGLHGGDATTS
jgi:nitrogen regulation protein NR(I)